MAYPVAAGHPQLSGSYIPNLFEKKLLVEFYASTILTAISNTDYQGMLSAMGDKVTISLLPDFTVRDYVKGQDLEIDSVEPTSVDLLIDRGKYWFFPINDVDRAQTHIKDYAQRWAAHAAQIAKIKVDTEVLSEIYSQAHASNIITDNGSAKALTNETIIGHIVDAGTLLDEQNVPDEGRWMALPPALCGLIKKSELKDASLAGDGTSMLRNGRLGMIDRFEIYRTNNLAKTGTAYHTVFGTKHALTFASQFTKTETLRNHRDFGDLMRGLQIYGFKVVKPEALGYAYLSAA